MSRVIGNLAEAWSRTYLEQQGFIWCCSNYSTPAGEIDLIMYDQQTLVFVEVRYRRNARYGGSIETVVRRKQHRLIKAAAHYLLATQATDQVDSRFDILGLTAGEEIYWIRNAFEVKYSS